MALPPPALPQISLAVHLPVPLVEDVHTVKGTAGVQIVLGGKPHCGFLDPSTGQEFPEKSRGYDGRQHFHAGDYRRDWDHTRHERRAIRRGEYEDCASRRCEDEPGPKRMRY